eukprot:460205_1
MQSILKRAGLVLDHKIYSDSTCFMAASGVLAHLIISLIILWIFTLPVLVHLIVKTYRVRKSILMTKRYIDGSLCVCIFALLWLFVNRTLELIRSYLYVNGSADDTPFIIFYCIEQTIYPLCAHGGVYALLYRFWMIYFDFIYSESIANQQWKIHINPQGSSPKEQWIIRHRKDYGNCKWIAIRLAVVYIVVGLCSASLRFLGPLNIVNPNTASTVDSALYLIPLGSIFTLWLKIPSFKDSFLVKDELKWIVVLYACALSINVCLVLFFKLNPEFNMYWNEAMWIVAVFITCVGLIYVQTQYILSGVKKNAVYFKHILSPIADGQSVSSKQRLRDILSNKVTFELFMHHITSELSTECIFSFIEFTQLKMLLETDDAFMDEVKKYDASAPSKMGKDWYAKVVLLDEETIPLSYIVFEHEYGVNSKIHRYKCIAIALANKYIYASADFCINVSYKTRGSVLAWIAQYCYDDREKELESQQFSQIYHLFDRCSEEMYKLMQSSVLRFVKTDAFLSLKRID